MARKVRSLGFGSRQGIKGHLHRSHRADKNQKKLNKSLFHLKQERKHFSSKQKKWGKEILRKEKVWIGNLPIKKVVYNDEE